MRPDEMFERTSNSPLTPAIGAHLGLPTGQQNSRVAMSSPIVLRSSAESSSSQSRTGRLPVPLA